jgi:hypothetical protein
MLTWMREHRPKPQPISHCKSEQNRMIPNYCAVCRQYSIAPVLVPLISKDRRGRGLTRNPGYPSAWKQVRVSTAASDTDSRQRGRAPHKPRDLFTQPPASRIDDAGRRCAGMRPNVQTRSACERQAASPACLSQESREFGPRDNRTRNPEYDGANERH